MFACGDARFPPPFASRLAPTEDQRMAFTLWGWAYLQNFAQRPDGPLYGKQKYQEKSSDRMIFCSGAGLMLHGRLGMDGPWFKLPRNLVFLLSPSAVTPRPQFAPRP
jgi:hypothetical protein